ncbi:MAG: amidophosphoribosyltransferase [Spirochaetes bacterium]|nr:amidophosphoribosyltransferase [Deltaproteobacteria bacterium]RKY00506.1 MAG: amidophosphoribosyltransferase [Spirochaetota bacterium]
MCGIVGVYGHPEAAKITYLGLHALQHRGQDGAKIASFNEKRFYKEGGLGLVSEVFNKERLKRLKGFMAIGHTRYSTVRDKNVSEQDLILNLQPLVREFKYHPKIKKEIAIVHNGQLTNYLKLKDELEDPPRGAIFSSSSDTEVLIHLIARCEEENIIQRILKGLTPVKGSYSLLFMTTKKIIGVRDPLGFRPLVLGRLSNGGYILASESCAFNLVEGKFVREIEPGEMIVIDKKETLRTFKLKSPYIEEGKHSQCVFELIYFARPDSVIFNRQVYSTRKRMGQILAKEYPIDADMVVPVPDSGFSASIGYSIESKIPLELGLMRSHYIGRTFIEPTQSIRHFGVKLKLSSIAEVLKGKSIVLVDDSIVRSTTITKIIQMIRAAGAKEIHVRISSPPITNPCYFGIDIPTKRELVASKHSVEEIRKSIGADTLAYLSLDGLKKAVEDDNSFCYACFTGEYPIR